MELIEHTDELGLLAHGNRSLVALQSRSYNFSSVFSTIFIDVFLKNLTIASHKDSCFLTVSSYAS